MLMIILLVVLVVALAGGGYGHSRVGYVGWSPAVIILLVIGFFYFIGSTHYSR
jgi:hypothetical protein